MPNVPEHSVARRSSNQRSLTIEQQIPEQLGDSVIVIRMLSAGVCGTDLALLSGVRPGQAEVLGHEGVGVVLHAPKYSGVSKGARVIINPVHRKRPEIVIGHSRDGIFRGLFCIDAADAFEGSFLVGCPEERSLGDAELALAEPLGSVVYSLELLREQCGTASLLIRGSGTLGILAAKLCASMAESCAILVSKSEAHARWLRETIR
jgi:threonine dehydrogenase-like Zn-dependent dehydrogenase